MASRGGRAPRRGRGGGARRSSGHAPQGSVVFETTETLVALASRDDAGIDAYVDALASAMSTDRARPLRADPRAFTTFMSRLNRAKRHDAALLVFEAQKRLGLERNAVNYNAAMVAHVKRDAPSVALDLFEEMRAVGHEPSVISFNVAMGACVRAGRGAEALALFDEMAEKGVDVDAVSVNTAIAAAEAVGDDARVAQLRAGAPFKKGEGEDETAASESDDSTDDSDDSEPDIARESSKHREDVVLEEEEEAKRLAARKRKREEKRELLARFNETKEKKSDDDDDDGGGGEMARRRRKDARKAKFEEKRRARKEAKRAKRPWTMAAAHAKKTETKSAKAHRRAEMKADPKVWVEDISDDDGDRVALRDEDGERILPPIKGPSFLDDPDAAKLMNARGGDDDFWSVGF